MNNDPFQQFSNEYDQWFERHPKLYEAELNAVREFIRDGSNGIEIGSGTGRFSLPLKIPIGAEPSCNMAEIARSRGMRVINARAERLPFGDRSFDFTLFVTTICFLDSIEGSLREAWRITKDGGFIVVAFIDKCSLLGKLYRKRKKDSLFFGNARFYSTKQVIRHLSKVGFKDFSYRQTIITLNEDEVQMVEEGFGKGGFVVIQGKKNFLPY
jgi:ubiquinone/menaquinone biosynthesis C-methylase UbiE